MTYLHVADVEASVAFYAALGFEVGNVYRETSGAAFWAAVKRDNGDGSAAELFFARASGPIDASQQAVLIYLYSADVAALRTHLLASGLHDGGHYHGQAGPNNGHRVVFEIYQPQHMPAGELRIVDPDGYVLLVGQLS